MVEVITKCKHMRNLILTKKNDVHLVVDHDEDVRET